MHAGEAEATVMKHLQDEFLERIKPDIEISLRSNNYKSFEEACSAATAIENALERRQNAVFSQEAINLIFYPLI